MNHSKKSSMLVHVLIRVETNRATKLFVGALLAALVLIARLALALWLRHGA